MKKTLQIISVALAAFAGGEAVAQTTNVYQLSDSTGVSFRMFTDNSFDAITALSAANGTSGYDPANGRIWMCFVRFGVSEHLLLDQSDPIVPFEQLQNASSIVYRTGVLNKEVGDAGLRDDDLGGASGDWYLIPDHHTTIGIDLDPLTNNTIAWDVANHPNSYFVQAYNRETDAPMMPDRADAPLDQFNVDVDITAAVKAAIADGTLTASTTSFSIAFIGNEVDYYDEEAGQYIESALTSIDLKRITGWKFQARGGDPTQLEVTIGGEPADWYGYAVDANGWANTEDWMGWVNISFDPWIWSTALDKYVYAEDDSGWIYVAK